VGGRKVQARVAAKAAAQQAGLTRSQFIAQLQAGGSVLAHPLHTSYLADSYSIICEQQKEAMTYEEIFVKLMDELDKPPPAFTWQQMLQDMKGQNPTLKTDLEQQVSEQDAGIIIDKFRSDWKTHNDHLVRFHSAYLKQFLK
jgi:hypothetical protein